MMDIMLDARRERTEELLGKVEEHINAACECLAKAALPDDIGGKELRLKSVVWSLREAQNYSNELQRIAMLIPIDSKDYSEIIKATEKMDKLFKKFNTFRIKVLKGRE